MNELMIFNNPEFGEIRGIEQGGEPWFVLKDVCAVLGISKYRDVAARLDPDERGSVRVDTPGGPQEMTIINESGLYSVILRSDKPEAKTFRRWVTHVVLPSIRRKGYYSAIPDEQLAKALVAGMSDEWKLDNVIIPALRQGDIDQSILVAKYMGLTVDEYEKNPKLLRKSADNLSAKRKISRWQGKAFTRSDIPEKYRNTPIILLAVSKMKNRYSSEGRFAEYCGTLYFNWRGYESIINYLLSQRIVSPEEAAKWKCDVRREDHAAKAIPAGMP